MFSFMTVGTMAAGVKSDSIDSKIDLEAPNMYFFYILKYIWSGRLGSLKPPVYYSGLCNEMLGNGKVSN